MERQKELNELFAEAIKQPKLAVGAFFLTAVLLVFCLKKILASSAWLASSIWASVVHANDVWGGCRNLHQLRLHSTEWQPCFLKKPLNFKPLNPYNGPAGVDPKSVVCEFFRHGKCTKGYKCKFSHDLNVERRGAKIDIFTERCCPWQPVHYAWSIAFNRRTLLMLCRMCDLTSYLIGANWMRLEQEQLEKVQIMSYNYCNKAI